MPKQKCGGCSKDVTGKSVQCACCNLWYHTPCVDMKEELYNNIVATHQAIGMHVWACKACTSSIKALNSRVVEIETKMRKIDEKVTTQGEKMTEVEATVETVQTKVDKLEKTVSETEPAEATKDYIFKEMAERETKKTNLVIHGITESTSPVAETRKEHDKGEFGNIMEVIQPPNYTEDDIKFMYRTGEREKNNDDTQTEPRPLVIGFRSEEMKTSVLRNCRKLKDSDYQHISISPDLTKRQRKEDSEIRAECTKLNAELSDDEKLNWIWKVIGQKGQRKLIKVKIQPGAHNTRQARKRTRSKEQTSPGAAKKR